MKKDSKTLIKPTGLNLLVEQIKQQEETSEAGIVLPPVYQRSKLCIGTVVAAGDGAYQFGQWIENPIKASDIIVYDPTQSVDFIHDHKTFTFVTNTMVMARVVKG